MSSASRYLAPRVPGGLLMGTGTEFSPGEEAILQALGSLSYQTGDLLYWDGLQLQRLAIGGSGNVLTVAAGLPSWAAAGGGGLALETPAGAVNGSNVTYATANTPKIVFTEAGPTVAGIGFTYSGGNIVMNLAPQQFIRSAY